MEQRQSITTLPSATEVTERAFPALLRSGTEKNASCHAHSHTSIAIIGYTSQGMRTKTMNTAAAPALPRKTAARVPLEFLSILLIGGRKR